MLYVCIDRGIDTETIIGLLGSTRSTKQYFHGDIDVGGRIFCESVGDDDGGRYDTVRHVGKF